MNRIISLIVVLILSLGANASRIETDRSWYLSGETMIVSIDFEKSPVAYAELCDMNGLAASTMVNLYEGKGKAQIELPADMHSGYYMLNVYSRNSDKLLRQLVAVVNPLHRSEDDDIEWTQVSNPDTMSYLSAHSFLLPAVSYRPMLKDETEGHIVQARIRNNYNGTAFSASQIRPSLSIVGKQIHYFEGKMINDTTAQFYTYGLHGKQSLVLSAATNTGVSLPIEIISPYAALLPAKLPHLVFNYNRKEVEQRSKDMQLHQISLQAQAAADSAASSAYDPLIYGKGPDFAYNLDEYRQFHTLKEVIIEYVNDVRRQQIDGVTQLVLNHEGLGYDQTPALVFIDGMPVINIDRLLNYDARRIHYINIYEDQYTFGKGIYKGILSFVSRTGRLTNYPTEPNVQYLDYYFPE